MAQASREAERQRQAQARAYTKAVRARERAEAAAARARVADERERKRLYAEARQDEAVALQAELDAFKTDLEKGNPESVRSYFEMVLGRSSWPDGFPQRFALAYNRDSKLLGIDYVLPDFTTIPAVKDHRYVKARDAIEQVRK